MTADQQTGSESPVEGRQQPTDLTELSLENLGTLQVTSVSRKAENLQETAAAIAVITSEDIRRAGATNIMEALRLAPGIQMARQSSHVWAISARGFNEPFANKLLVMIDGRSVYTPMFSGVHWDTQDVLLEDIDRIEVIRGPGATLWGANAVNGVINIITKKARDTQGLIVSAGGGTDLLAAGHIRHGGRFSENTHARIYGKYFKRDKLANQLADDWWMTQGGFRVDREKIDGDHLTIQGDVYGNGKNEITVAPTLNPPYRNTGATTQRAVGGNLLARWIHRRSDTSDLSVQGYYDFQHRAGDVLKEQRHTMDLDTQLRFTVGHSQEIVVGGGYRYSRDMLTGTFRVVPSDAGRAFKRANGYIQNEITIVPNRFRVIVGTKLEHNSFTGFEFQPSGRMVWTPHGRHTIWSAVSRAVRTPSRGETTARLNQQVIPPGVPPSFSPAATLISFFGNPNMKAETLTAYELGYRSRPNAMVLVELAGFYNTYHHLRTLEPGTPGFETTPAPPHALLPFSVQNNMYGESFGFEVQSTWLARPWWQLQGQYSYLHLRLHLKPTSADPFSLRAERESPRHQIMIRSGWNLAHYLELNNILRFVDELPSSNVARYWSLDMRLGWRITRQFELTLIGQDLFGKHGEFLSTPLDSQQIGTRVQPGVFGHISWRF